MSSFEKINYTLRPNKSIERKMMAEALGRLCFVDHLHTYRYIGFGSPYFADFILFHKSLGINDLISIEKEIDKEERFEFNLPYLGIKMEYGMSNTILPNLGLDQRKSIVWLDYDDKISDFMFSDIDTFFTDSIPGSFFVLSLNVEEVYLKLKVDETMTKDSLQEFRILDLIDRCGKSRIPIEFMSLNMTTKNTIKVSYEMLSRQIAASLNKRNGHNTDKVEYKQIFNFVYKDNATILTIGGILIDKSLKAKYKKMDFESLSYFVKDEKSYKIQSPNLTFREIKALDKALPDDLELLSGGRFKSDKLQAIPLIAADIKNYAKVYRYFPNFTEANI